MALVWDGNHGPAGIGGCMNHLGKTRDGGEMSIHHD